MLDGPGHHIRAPGELVVLERLIDPDREAECQQVRGLGLAHRGVDGIRRPSRQMLGAPRILKLEHRSQPQCVGKPYVSPERPNLPGFDVVDGCPSESRYCANGSDRQMSTDPLFADLLTQHDPQPGDLPVNPTNGGVILRLSAATGQRWLFQHDGRLLCARNAPPTGARMAFHPYSALIWKSAGDGEAPAGHPALRLRTQPRSRPLPADNCTIAPSRRAHAPRQRPEPAPTPRARAPRAPRPRPRRRRRRHFATSPLALQSHDLHTRHAPEAPRHHRHSLRVRVHEQETPTQPQRSCAGRATPREKVRDHATHRA